MFTWLLTQADLFSIISFLLAIPGLILSLYLFFKDPIRKWVFFGFRPTVVLFLFDPKTKKVLLINDHKVWGLPQGGIYSSNLIESGLQVLSRELSIGHSSVQFRYWKVMGSVRVVNKYKNKRATIGNISLFSEYRGKGYIAFYVLTNLQSISKKIKLGPEIQTFQVVTTDIARKILDSEKNLLINKKKLILKALDELEINLKERDRSLQENYI